MTLAKTSEVWSDSGGIVMNSSRDPLRPAKHVVVAALFLVLAGCRGQKPPARSANTSPAAQQSRDRMPARSGGVESRTPKVSDKDRAAIRDMGIHSPCALHAGDSQAERQETRSPTGQVESVVTTGSCAFNAECVRQQGTESPGDGDVEVECRDRACSCSLRSWSPAERTLSFSFQIDEVCSTADLAERLLRDVCMAGLISIHGGGGHGGRRDQ